MRLRSRMSRHCDRAAAEHIDVDLLQQVAVDAVIATALWQAWELVGAWYRKLSLGDAFEFELVDEVDVRGWDKQ